MWYVREEAHRKTSKTVCLLLSTAEIHTQQPPDFYQSRQFLTVSAGESKGCGNLWGEICVCYCILDDDFMLYTTALGGVCVENVLNCWLKCRMSASRKYRFCCAWRRWWEYICDELMSAHCRSGRKCWKPSVRCEAVWMRSLWLRWRKWHALLRNNCHVHPPCFCGI